MEQSRKEKLDDIRHEITILKDDIKSIKYDMKELKKILLCRNVVVSEVKLTDKQLSEEATTSWFWS
tara:strand:- start:909 stop:1106 length:198 start_codon:yes stop_codon:yes gene_type:complete